MSLSVRERIEAQVAHAVDGAAGISAQRWDAVTGNTHSTPGGIVAIVTPTSERLDEQSQGAAGAVAEYVLTLDVTLEIVQAGDDATSTATLVNEARDAVLRAVLTDPNLTETADGGNGDPLAVDTSHASTEGPLAAVGEGGEAVDGVTFLIIAFDIRYQVIRDNPAAGPGIAERS